jgi:hypothetical protein
MVQPLVNEFRIVMPTELYDLKALLAGLAVKIPKGTPGDIVKSFEHIQYAFQQALNGQLHKKKKRETEDMFSEYLKDWRETYKNYLMEKTRKDILSLTSPIFKEVGALSAALQSDLWAPESGERTEFGKETFGGGRGVRKDTHLPPIRDSGGKPRLSVAELRSNYVINRFLERV